MSEIRDCIAPDRNPRRPRLKLPAGSVDTHVHVFEAGYPLAPGRGYNPPPSTLSDLKHLHATLGIERVVFTQPSVYGIDNAAILNAMVALNNEQADRARSVVALDMTFSETDLASLDKLGVRGIRLNTDNQGGMPIAFSDIPELCARIKPFLAPRVPVSGEGHPGSHAGVRVAQRADVDRALRLPAGCRRREEIGRASCRERV